VVLPLLAGLLVLLVALVAMSRRNRRTQEAHKARISQEIERIRGLESSGRISSAESTELIAALDDRRADEAGTPALRRLCKSASPLLLGVCGGLAEWLGWDATLVRVGYVLATLLIAGFPGIIVYLIMALVMPRHPEAPPAKAGRVVLLLLVLVLVPLALLLGAASCLFLVRASGPVVHQSPVIHSAPATP
jgi:phage shock protein PspC (stress-responsive transcriptional regulator)